MLSRLQPLARAFSTSSPSGVSVAVCGASGGIGQPLSLLLKLNPAVTKLSLYDVGHTLGVAADLSHIQTRARVTGYVGPDQLEECLQGADIVLVPAGVARNHGTMKMNDLFNANCAIVATIAAAAAKVCPDAMMAIITNPVNSTVPIACEVYKKAGVFDPKRIFGVTTLDAVRANTFIGQIKGVDPLDVECPVVGGHAGPDIIPLVSQCEPKVELDQETLDALTERIQDAGTEVVKAKAGAGSATISMAYAAARFTDSLIKGMRGEEVVECAYVASDLLPEVKYLATPLVLGPGGAERNLGLGEMTQFEQDLLKVSLKDLNTSIEKGERYVKEHWA